MLGTSIIFKETNSWAQIEVEHWKNLSTWWYNIKSFAGKIKHIKKKKKFEIFKNDITVPFLIVQYSGYRFLNIVLSREELSRAGRVSGANFEHSYSVVDILRSLIRVMNS